jgi:hypothetical protein
LLNLSVTSIARAELSNRTVEADSEGKPPIDGQTSWRACDVDESPSGIVERAAIWEGGGGFHGGGFGGGGFHEGGFGGG